jgi:hypothetical protein
VAANFDDHCPRCGGAFHCGVNDAEPCPCTELQLPEPTLSRLRERFDGCLCLRCLRTLAENPQEIGDVALPPA